MSRLVVTLVSSALADATVEGAAQKLRALGGGSVTQDVLSAGQAVDLFLDVAPRADLLARLREEFQNLQDTDVFIQPDTPDRRKRLLVADMDATIVVGETLDELAAHLGLADKIVPITARAMRGELDFAQALVERVALLKGAPAEALAHIRDAIQPTPGAQTLVRTMAARGARCVLASGGFDLFTGAVAGRLGFHAHHGNNLLVDTSGVATGHVALPILDKQRKVAILQQEARDMGLQPAQTLAVGDGANDIPMLQAAGIGVAYHAKPLVNAAVPCQVRHGDLTSLLYLQGYARREWRT